MSNMIDIKSIHHEFQILPLDFLMSATSDPNDLYVSKEIREKCGYSWLTPETISLKGEMGVLFNNTYDEENGYIGSDYGLIAFGDGKNTWFDIIHNSYDPIGECYCYESENIDFENKLPNTKLRFLINKYEIGETLQPLELAFNEEDNVLVVGSPIKVNPDTGKGELILKFNGYRYSFKNGTYRKLKEKNILAFEPVYETDTKRLKIGLGEKSSEQAEENSYLNLNYISEDWWGGVGEEIIIDSERQTGLTYLMNIFNLAWWEDYKINIKPSGVNNGFTLNSKFYELSGTITITKDNINSDNPEDNDDILQELYNDINFEKWPFEILTADIYTLSFEYASCTIEGYKKDTSKLSSNFSLRNMTLAEKAQLL